MRNFIAALTVLCILGGSATLSSAQEKGKKTTKVADVWVCPMTGEAVTKGHEAGTPVVVDGKRVHFCCGGCPAAFAKLTPAQKKLKVAEAAKKAAASKG